MSAPVRIEAEAFADERIQLLGLLCGYSRYEALGRLAHLWSHCTARGSYVVSAAIANTIIGGPRMEGAEGLIMAELGELADEGIRVRGTFGRIEWLEKLRENSKRGGLANKRRLEALRGNGESQLASQTEAKPKPKPSPLTLTPTLTRSEISPSERYVNADSQVDSQVDSQLAPRKGRPRKPKLSEPSDAERESVRVVLEKLGSRNGVRYAGSPAHVQLIVGRLRDGYTEMDLRKVIGYCAEQWRGNDKMLAYLRPETLFGPQTIARYVDAARAWFETLPQGEERAG